MISDGVGIFGNVKVDGGPNRVVKLRGVKGNFYIFMNKVSQHKNHDSKLCNIILVSVQPFPSRNSFCISGFDK